MNCKHRNKTVVDWGYHPFTGEITTYRCKDCGEEWEQ